MASDNHTVPKTAAAGTFSAADLRRRMAEREAAKAAEELQRMREHEEKQKAVMAEFHKPPERTPEQLMQLVTTLVNHAAEAGQTEVQVYRFPNALAKIAAEPSTISRRNGTRHWKAGPGWPTNSGTTI